MVDAPIRAGDILASKYRVEHVLGAGAMGVVVAARHVSLGQLVALKFMLAGKAANPSQRERFLREARAAVRLKSQHVARVLDVGTLENESPYIVMEFLEGQDLDARLKARGPLPIGEAIEYVLQTCEAVGEAHAAGIVHRDLKPANLFLTTDIGGMPCIKVLDFGISKLSGVELSLTNESQSMGSPLYMSPEQMRSSKHVDARSDIWSLGVILYQLIAALTPFHSETIAELCSRVLHGSPTPLGRYRSDAPPELEAVIMRCLQRERGERFRNVAELAAALAPFAPPRARVYTERVARALGIQAEVGSATAELPLGAVSPAAVGKATVPLNASPPPPLPPSGAPVLGPPPTPFKLNSPPAPAQQLLSSTDSELGGTTKRARGPQGSGRRAAVTASIVGILAAAIGIMWVLWPATPRVEPGPATHRDAPASTNDVSLPSASPSIAAATSAEPSASPTARASASAPASEVKARPRATASSRKQPPPPPPPTTTTTAQPMFEGVY